MTVSIIVCTRNRAESLRPTLASIAQTAVPQGWDIELLVVDNGSTDSTPSVIGDARLNNVVLRHIGEPRAGKCRALNTALEAAVGDVILLTDDDVRVPAHWIEGMCRKILEGQADAVAGGVVFPPAIDFAINASHFRTRRGWLASTEGLDPRHPRRLVGANMAFHRRVLSKVPGFDVELGPGALGFDDETLFSWQLMAAGYRVVGAFDVAVEHHFDVNRLTEAGLRDSALKMARSRAFIVYHWDHRKLHLTLPRLVLRHLRRLLAGLFDRGGKNAGRDLSSEAIMLEADIAFYRECLVQRRRPRKYPYRAARRIQPEA